MMKKQRKTSIEIHDPAKNFESARSFVLDMLNANDIADVVISETMLIFEALYHNLLEENKHNNLVLNISEQHLAGDIRVVLGFGGDLFVPQTEDAGISPENRILDAYADKIGCSYHSGYNTINISVRRSHGKTLNLCLAGLILAVAVFFVLCRFTDEGGRADILNDLVYPVERLFTNALLMIAAPVTFFSLLKNMTDSYIISQRSSNARRLHLETVSSTIVVSALAVIVSFSLLDLFSGHEALLQEYNMLRMKLSPDIVSSLIPSDIFTPFTTISPFPLIIVASLVTYAFCSAGKYFDMMKVFVDSCYVLFSRMLSIVMSTLPFFSFVAAMHFLLRSGYSALLYLARLTIVGLLSIVVITLYYILRLCRQRIPVRPFIKDLIPLLSENYKINSAIDAVPFNIRYCIRVFRMDRKMLEKSLPVLAQLNLDGNCYLITLLSLILVFSSGMDVTWFEVATIVVLVIFLSLGAPNQPGSFAIGFFIIINYLQAYNLLPLAIYAEVVFGSILNLINITGDIVTVATEEARLSRREKQAQERAGHNPQL